LSQFTGGAAPSDPIAPNAHSHFTKWSALSDILTIINMLNSNHSKYCRRPEHWWLL